MDHIFCAQPGATLAHVTPPSARAQVFGSATGAVGERYPKRGTHCSLLNLRALLPVEFVEELLEGFFSRPIGRAHSGKMDR
jgi:hypothetical protein